MKKSDLVNGSVVETRDGRRYLVVDETLLNLDMTGAFMHFNNYNEELKTKNGNLFFDIIKINNVVTHKDNVYGACNKCL